MSYARFGWEGSDVYMYARADGNIDCAACSLMDYPDNSGGHMWPGSRQITNDEDLIDHLKQHKLAGDNVPDTLLPAILQDNERYTPYKPNERE